MLAGFFVGFQRTSAMPTLSDIRRQHDEADRETIKRLIGGDAIDAIQRLSDAGQLRVESDDQVAEAMVE